MLPAAVLRLALALALVALALPSSSARSVSVGRGRGGGRGGGDRAFQLPTLATILEGEEDAADGGEGDGDVCIKAEFPLKFRSPVDFNVNEGFGPVNDQETDLKCHCEENTCSCVGEGVNCDEYSQVWFYAMAYAHQFGAFFYALPLYENEYHLQSMAFWVVLGMVLSWVGFIMVVWIEVKAVAITRARDERRKLVQIRAMERSGKMVQLEQQERKVMTPRPYITLCGGMILFIGLFCQLIPFCHLLRELGLPVMFHGMCPLFVFTSSAMLATTSLLLLLGIIWSCTRGFAALVFVTLALAGDLLIFTGVLGCVVWAVVSALVLYVYLVVLPEQFKDCRDPNDPNNGTYPVWLQDAGEFEVEADLGKIGNMFAAGGGILSADLTDNAMGEQVKDLRKRFVPEPEDSVDATQV
mmetsp:Transcript_69340/g.164594  ORF Transcript_69340/g.164594 Transcript_69340/m.164594 type:complete len:412 (-) Transcript_69340:155-1390(-)